MNIGGKALMPFPHFPQNSPGFPTYFTTLFTTLFSLADSPHPGYSTHFGCLRVLTGRQWCLGRRSRVLGRLCRKRLDEPQLRLASWTLVRGRCRHRRFRIIVALRHHNRAKKRIRMPATQPAKFLVTLRLGFLRKATLKPQTVSTFFAHHPTGSRLALL